MQVVPAASTGVGLGMSDAFIPGPWVAENGVSPDQDDWRGLAVIAVLPEAERDGIRTPTRGMVAWVNAGLGACSTDEQAIATGRLIAAAPELLAALQWFVDDIDGTHTVMMEFDANVARARAAIAKATQP